jgi:UPF0716 protein FxsA
MFTIKALLNFFEREFILRVLYLILLFSLFILADSYVLLRISDHMGMYAALAITASTGLVGFLYLWSKIKKSIQTIKQKTLQGNYPQKEFSLLAGQIITCFFLIGPGLFTDFIGLWLLIPAICRSTGKFITQRIDNQLKEAYEYLKIYEH